MVYLKVSDGNETRKLQVTPGEITFDQLKEQLATFFPKALAGDASSSGLTLQYRDADGDVITLSSDQELQEALSQLQEDGVWKLYIRNGQRGSQKSAPSSATQQNTQRGNRCGVTSLFHNLFEPSVRRPFGLFSDVWDDLEQHLQLLHQLHSEVFSSSDAKTDKKDTTESQQKTRSEEVPSKSKGEATPTTTEQQAAEDPDEVVKSKPQAATDSDKKQGKDESADKNDDSQWHTRRFVTWEPRLHIGPFGFFHSHLTPVVYKVSYKSSSSSSADNGCCSSNSSAAKGGESASEAGAKKTETQEQQEQAASPAAENRVEESATTTTESGILDQPSEAAQ